MRRPLRHDRLVRTVVEGHHGYVFATMGDGSGVAFQRASNAVAAAVELQESFTSEERMAGGLRVRVGLPHEPATFAGSLG